MRSSGRGWTGCSWSSCSTITQKEGVFVNGLHRIGLHYLRFALSFGMARAPFVSAAASQHSLQDSQ